MKLGYLIETRPDDYDQVLIIVPSFPEFATFAAPEEGKIQRHARDAIEEAIAARIADGDPVPSPDADRGRRGQLVVEVVP